MISSPSEHRALGLKLALIGFVLTSGLGVSAGDYNPNDEIPPDAQPRYDADGPLLPQGTEERTASAAARADAAPPPVAESPGRPLDTTTRAFWGYLAAGTGLLVLLVFSLALVTNRRRQERSKAGAAEGEQKPRCPTCAVPLKRDAAFCPACGARVDTL